MGVLEKKGPGSGSDRCLSEPSGDHGTTPLDCSSRCSGEWEYSRGIGRQQAGGDCRKGCRVGQMAHRVRGIDGRAQQLLALGLRMDRLVRIASW